VFDTELTLESINQTIAGKSNFELTSDTSLKSGWAAATASLEGKSSVSVSIFEGLSAIAGVRYSWSGVPDGLFVYDATCRLPAGPFVAACSGTACALVAPGKLPL